MNIYKAMVRVITDSNSSVLVETQISAVNMTNARWLLEAQYGKDSVCSIQPK